MKEDEQKRKLYALLATKPRVGHWSICHSCVPFVITVEELGGK